MRDQTDFNAWPKDGYCPKGWMRVELIKRDGAISNWKFFVHWVAHHGYADAVATMERIQAKVEEGERKRQSPFESNG